MAAVGAGDDEVGTRAFVVAAKQQFRVGHHDRVGVIRVGVYYRRSAVSARCGRVSHSTLPATPLIERERPTHPLAGLRAATLFVVPQWPANGATLL
jgi:hypothetical protein